jgi:sigma-B regulation protein RsbU (phosphoserine phosphatase)
MNNSDFKILIVDDIPKNIQILGAVLTESGYNVEFATNGEDAIQWALNEAFDLILLDVMMPEMNGFEVCSLLKSLEKTYEIPIIFLTAKNDTDSILKGFKVGAVDYISKPFNADELLVRVNTHINLRYTQKMLHLKNLELIKKNQQVEDSVNYASRIQQAALPQPFQLKEILPEHFLLYKPRDIVSGDFYWIKKLDNQILVTVGDCTGHGVPGAFMSLLGLSFLNEIVYEGANLSSSNILSLLGEKIIKLLKVSYEELIVRDGIDIAFCLIDYDSYKMQFASANSTALIVREGDFLSDEIISPNKIFVDEKNSVSMLQLSGTKSMIGSTVRLQDITNQIIQLKPNDLIYMFSDGFFDQLGGNKNRRYTKKRFVKLIQSLFNLSLEAQCKICEEEFINWTKDSFPQLDDIIILGFKIL